MRYLFLLRGAPGSGKDTLIDSWGVREQTLGFDMMRALFGTTIHTFEGASPALGNKVDRLAREATFAAVEARMHNGETLFISNTNTSAQDIKGWMQVAARHAYEVIAVNVQGDLTDEDLLARNASRPEKDKVVEEVILSMANRYRAHQPVPGVRYITPDEVMPLLAVETFDASEYEEVVVIGDVQGCGEALTRLLAQVGDLSDPSRLFVFVGDLFDRGPTPRVVHDLLSRPRHNVVLVEGNHERSVRETLTGVRSYRASAVTVEQVCQGGSTKSLSNLINRGRPFFPFTFGGKTRWVSHAGFDPVIFEGKVSGGVYMVGLLPNREFMIGTGSRENGYRNVGTYTDFSERLDAATSASPLVDVQYFGHRNDDYEREPLSYESIRPLESEVEQGEFLSAVVISRDGTERLVKVAGEGFRRERGS